MNLIRKGGIVMNYLTDLIVVIGFALSCFSLGYTIGRNSKANK